MTAEAPLLAVENASVEFGGRKPWFGAGKPPVRAVTDVSLEIMRGEVVGLVGESGSGKTTLGRAILRLVDLKRGRITFDGEDATALDARGLKALRRRMQIVFQDPYASLNPRFRVGEIVGEGLRAHGVSSRRERRERVAAMLDLVGLRPEHMDRFPAEFSGGQRQRIGIARALAVEPDFVVADEPVSALDVSIQAQVTNLLQDLQERLGLTMLFISHDLSLVEYLCDRVVVLYLGRVMETAPTEALFDRPQHPYTRALLQAIPVPGPAARTLAEPLRGDIPSPVSPPSGCVFRTRCPNALPACAETVPALRGVGDRHFKACIRDDILL